MMNQEMKKLLDLQNNAHIDRLMNPTSNEPRYVINNEHYFSVTQVLDDGRFRNVNPVRLFQAKILGTITHLYIENYFKKSERTFNIDNVLGPQDYEIFKQFQKRDSKEWENYRLGLSDDTEEIFLINRIETAFNQFLKFIDDHQTDLTLAEKVIWNPVLLYAGTMDLLCILDGELTIIDHKTSRFIKKEINGFDPYTGQLSAYLYAIRTLTESEVGCQLKILHLNPMASSYELIERPYQISMFLDAFCNFTGGKPSPDYTKAHRINFTENSRINNNGRYDSQFSDELELAQKEKKENKVKEILCKDQFCNEHSIYQISFKDLANASSGVKILPKVSYHEDANHYHISHFETQNWNVIKEFIVNK